MKCYKRLKYKRFVQVSGLCISYLCKLLSPVSHCHRKLAFPVYPCSEFNLRLEAVISTQNLRNGKKMLLIMLNDFERYVLRNVVRTKGSFAGPSSSILRFDKRKAKISQMMSLTALLTFSNLLAVSRLEFLHLVSGTGLISYLAIELFWRKVFSRINFL